MVTPWRNIDEARKSQCLTLKEMARRANVSEAAVQKWKKGKPITFDTLERIAVALNTTAIALLSRASEQAPASEVSGPHSPTPALLRETPPPYGAAPPAADLAAIERRLSNLEQLLLSILAEQRQRNTQNKKGT